MFTNDKDPDTNTIKIMAYVRVDYWIKGNVVRFNDLLEDTKVTHRIEVASFMAEPLELRHFTAPFDGVSCTFGQLDEKDQYYIDVTVDITGCSAGRFVDAEFGRDLPEPRHRQVHETGTHIVVHDVESEPAPIRGDRQLGPIDARDRCAALVAEFRSGAQLGTARCARDGERMSALAAELRAVAVRDPARRTVHRPPSLVRPSLPHRDRCVTWILEPSDTSVSS